MSTIIKKITTETAHIVRNAATKRCQTFHGHRYQWEIYVDGPIDPETGMVLDFKLLKPIKDFINKFDHSTVLWDKEDETIKYFFLNNFSRILIMRKNCTAENMARLALKYTNEIIKKEFGENYSVSKVRVWETETGCAESTEYDENDIFIFEQLNTK